MTIDHEGIENQTLSILEAYNITEPVVDVGKVAKSKDIAIKEITMPGNYSDVAGFYDKNTKTIYLDVADKPSRKLFTIAHELGHVFLEHHNYGALFRVPNEKAKYGKEEKKLIVLQLHC